MNKRELIRQLSNRMNCPQCEAAGFLEHFMELLSHGFKHEESIRLMDFGSFNIRHKASRNVLVPGTNRKITIAAHNTVGFKASKRLLTKMNPV